MSSFLGRHKQTHFISLVLLIKAKTNVRMATISAKDGVRLFRTLPPHWTFMSESECPVGRRVSDNI